MGINLVEKGYNKVNAANPGEFVKLPPGGYVCKVVWSFLANAKESGAPMFVLYLDIAEGDFKGYFGDATKRKKNFNPDVKWVNEGTYRQRFYDGKGNVAPFFKGLLTLLERDNPNIKINPADFEPENFLTAQIGMVFVEEESEFNGNVTVKVVPKIPKSVEDIRKGNFKVPELKRLPDSSKDTGKDDFGGTPVNPNDTPF